MEYYMEKISIDASVIGTLPGAKFKLELPNKKNIIACISGKIRKNNIHISLGDKVKVEFSSDSKDIGRIVYRYKL
ncbi:translation initiation factor IF-1 [Candidatus Phytoplasma asiaticum]|uniref:translation initiation factor IF-1 n=1 Tax=Candidatus Phytoplasma asiaticum TaxID=2763338 RepID=UPI003F6C1A71